MKTLLIGLLLAAAAFAAERASKTLVITYEDGKKQTVRLEQPSSGIVRLEFGEPGAPGARDYTDKGSRIHVACGSAAFADRVEDYRVGNPAPPQAYRTLDGILGEPDYNESKETGFLTLGCGGSVVLEFTKVALVDGPGADLHVFEIGPSVEPTQLEISEDGEEWVRVGNLSGGKASADIGSAAQPGASYRFVRLTDLRSACGGESPGADIDAVAAISCEQR